MFDNNVTHDKAYAFAIRVVNAYKHLTQTHREYVMSKQMLRSGTSIGANITEANGAISDADFSHKISIAYKECLETKYWLHLLKDTDYMDLRSFESMHGDADEIARILFAILKTTRIRRSETKTSRPK